MKVTHIFYNKNFEKQFRALRREVQEKAVEVESLFKENPFHPSLRLHKLKGKLEGLWSISIDRKNRIIFDALENGEILFVSIGGHSIYS
jgi:mRNA-degrading endonuclease YafQ of YafQ-DinJ toxin-antitoxin module